MGFNRAREPWEPGPVFTYAFDLSGTTDTPRLCLLATAGGDQRSTIQRFHAAFDGSPVEVSHLTLFDKPNVPDVEEHLRGQDVIWVDRGSLVNLLAVWRVHGLDRVLRDCWQSGVVLGGESAGSLCWHLGGTTDSYGEVRGVADGLGFLPYSNAVHYAERRELFHRLIADGDLPDGYATDAGAGLHYEDTKPPTAIADRRQANAYRVERRSDGTVREEPIDVLRLKR
ncbi:peptidase E [Saccharothrix sp. CB00851]|nr:peptidase E [Saccharothrix sp. CB00851]